MRAPGDALLLLLDAALPEQVTVITHPYGRELIFSQTEQTVDEDARMRLLLTLVGQPQYAPKAMFVGGLLAHDLVAGFESLLPLRPGQRCPDYCFYLAETLLILDHQQQTCELQCSLFSPNAAEKQRLQHRLEQLQHQLTQAPEPIPHQVIDTMTLTCRQSDEEYGQIVRRMQQAIR